MVQTFEQCIFYLLEFKNIFFVGGGSKKGLKICKIVFFIYWVPQTTVLKMSDLLCQKLKI